MKKLIYLFVILASLFISCGKEDNPINGEDNKDDAPEDKTEVQHILITANVSENFKLPVGTRCEAEFYDKDGKKVDCKKTLASASERSFHIGADLDKGKQYTCLLWFDNGEYGYDISGGLKSIKMSTKPALAFYGKLSFNSDTPTYDVEMKPAVAQAVLKLNNVIPNSSGIFSISETTPIKYVFNVEAGTAISTDVIYIPKTVFLLNSSGKVAEFHTFVPDGGMNVNLQIDYNGKAETIEDVTMQKGRTTALEGDLETMIFSTTITDITVIVE